MTMVHPGNYSVAAAMALGGTLASILHGISLSDSAIFAVALAAGVASYRSKKNDVVRRNNADLEDRNRVLEAEKVRDLARITALEMKLQSLPNLDTQAELLQKLLDRLQSHDEAMAQAVENNQTVFRELVTTMQGIHDAVSSRKDAP